MVLRLECIVVVLAVTANVFAAVDCDRACLKTTRDQYLNAVIKHDASAAPLLIGFRQTENATVVKLGNGVWKTITGLGKVQRRYVDAISGQAGYFGIVEENGAPAIATLRLKVENRKITEAEWVISRKGDPGLNGPAGGNGVTMAGRGAAPRGGGGPGTVRDCTSGLETINIQNVAARRLWTRKPVWFWQWRCSFE